MFVHEAWGVDAEDGEQLRGGFAVAGKRLVVHKDQLLNFLREQALDLMIEVEVERRERKIDDTLARKRTRDGKVDSHDSSPRQRRKS